MMSLFKIAVLSASLLMPCVPECGTEEPAVKLQEYVPADAGETLTADDQWGTVLYEEAAAEADTVSGESDGLDIRYLLFLQEFHIQNA